MHQIHFWARTRGESKGAEGGGPHTFDTWRLYRKPRGYGSILKAAKQTIGAKWTQLIPHASGHIIGFQKDMPMEPLEPQIIVKTVFRDFPTFSRICIFFLLTLSLLIFSLLIFLFFLPLPCSAFHLSILSEVWLLNFLRLTIIKSEFIKHDRNLSTWSIVSHSLMN